MTRDNYERFFQSPAFAVVDAAKSREKFGNKVLRCYLQHGKKVYPVNPRAEKIEGLVCSSSVSGLPESVKSISPAMTATVVREAIANGIENIWMQPGAESAEAVELSTRAGINTIADGSCILKYLGFSDT